MFCYSCHTEKPLSPEIFIVDLQDINAHIEHSFESLSSYYEKKFKGEVIRQIEVLKNAGQVGDDVVSAEMSKVQVLYSQYEAQWKIAIDDKVMSAQRLREITKQFIVFEQV